MVKIVALICARGGSKGIKNKNLLKIKGNSLLQIAINQAKKLTLLKIYLFHQDQIMFRLEIVFLLTLLWEVKLYEF
jgi:CMP-N-acetylneuraminic acid synthetase